MIVRRVTWRIFVVHRVGSRAVPLVLFVAGRVLVVAFVGVPFPAGGKAQKGKN
jgi:hypothetical protein